MCLHRISFHCAGGRSGHAVTTTSDKDTAKVTSKAIAKPELGDSPVYRGLKAMASPAARAAPAAVAHAGSAAAGSAAQPEEPIYRAVRAGSAVSTVAAPHARVVARCAGAARRIRGGGALFERVMPLLDTASLTSTMGQHNERFLSHLAFSGSLLHIEA